ncbi:MAG: prepilin-type N-terminal cleavage/methylation domain-containing protein [Candidatus Pacebacteria bacterium]|nr:prepilin-type N-terminal cleavage/methylation domain-containing protein [Candidatus Paceibacterota bacterium]MBP9843184.1 prepilin-type N-terminal cleavage/methylation domain-containing protein [Candidatus Paceibacterota bacterium]
MLYRTTRGFTLIEILVVIAIIGILASVLMVNFGSARDSAKNKSIRAAMGEIQLALEVYKAQNRRYPPNITALVPEYISALPVSSDSGNANCSIDNSQYTTDGSGTYYKFVAHRCFAGATSAATGVQQGDKYARCAISCSASGNCVPSSVNYYESMAVYSLGGEC